MNKTKHIAPLTLYLLITAVALTPFFSSGEAGGVQPLFQEETPDTTGTPADTIETSPPDSLKTPQVQPRTSIMSRMPADTTATSQDTLKKSTEVSSPPDTSGAVSSRPDTTAGPEDTTVAPAIPPDTTAVDLTPTDTLPTDTLSIQPAGVAPPVADTTISPRDTTGIPALPPDTTTVDLVPTDTTVAHPAEPDTTAPSPADTMFGKTYMAYIGETMFTHERSSPFPATYVYKYAGFVGDTTFRVNLATDFLHQSYRSYFQFPVSGTDTLSLGPFDLWIDAADSISIVFELLGYTQLPEPEIPERVEEVAEAVEPETTAAETIPQLVVKESPTTPEEYFSRGYIQAAKGNYDEAKQDLQTALEMDSTLFAARLTQGWILLEEKDSTAVEAFRQCAELKPNDVTASFFLAYSLEKQGSPEDAYESYTKIMEVDSSNARSLFQLASISLTRGDSSKADVFLEMARGFKPDIDSSSAAPSLSDIPHVFWWSEEWPELVHFEEPQYPDSAAADSLECTVEVYILVNRKGKPANVKIHEPCDYTGFNESAEAAARKCTFSPGKVNGKPVRVWISVPYRFELPTEEEPLAGAQVGADSTLAAQVTVPDTGEVQPELIEFVQPEYPQDAIEDSIETTVLLNVLVGTDGLVTDVKFLQADTLNQTFNEAAEAAARQCRFQPGLRDGKADTMWTELPMTFSLTSPPIPLPAAPPPDRPVPADIERGKPQLPPGAQEKASAYVQGMMLAQQGKYDEALDLVQGSLQSDPKDKNSHLLYGLIILAKETGKRMDEVTSLAGQPEQGVYWWADTMPQRKEFKEAEYPDNAKESGIEGTVLLYVLVDETGGVVRVTVVRQLEERSLNEAAEKAARDCTFTPGTLQGQPVKVWTRLPYEFKLNE